MVGEDAPWQQRKSSETRIRILEATIDCLVEKGYSKLSTSEVTARSGASRGAMHHHFPTRMATVAAAIDYILYKRMDGFLQDYFSSLKKKTQSKSATVIANEAYWRSVQTREYSAYLELAIAARTDAELNSHFLPTARKFDKVWRDEMVKAFPEWEGHMDKLLTASDFAMSAHMGLLLHRPIFGEGKRTRQLMDLILKVMEGLHQGG
jgi:AcrR family transcriptional regulator